MDNLGAIGGPLLALALVGLVGVRTAILLSIIPGLLAVAAILYAIRHTTRPSEREHRPIRLRVRPVLQGPLGRLMLGIGAFELGNIAATLLILRATDVLDPGRPHDDALQHALVLYALYNAAAALTSVPAGRLAIGAASFGSSPAGSPSFRSRTRASRLPMAAWRSSPLASCSPGGIGCAETAEHAAVAQLAPENVQGSAFGLLAAVQAFGNLVASSIAGLLYTIALLAAASGSARAPWSSH